MTGKTNAVVAGQVPAVETVDVSANVSCYVYFQNELVSVLADEYIQVPKNTIVIMAAPNMSYISQISGASSIMTGEAMIDSYYTASVVFSATENCRVDFGR